MTLPTRSFEKVPYHLRRAKQVERRMLIDALQILADIGFPIREYQYTGFGSTFFVDFTLFHKLLGINKMLSVEIVLDIEKRVRFNKPFDCIDIAMKPIADVIPDLSADQKHILWLDYDDILHRERLEEITSAAAQLSLGSILLVTLDAEPPKGDEPNQWRDYYIEQAGRYLGTSAGKIENFAKSNLPKIIVQIIRQAIKEGLAGRRGVEFIPLFNFVYSDGHLMLSLGGMLGTQSNRRRIRTSKLKEANYIRFNLKDEPFNINIPNLTLKERMRLDHAMPCAEGWVPEEFEIKSEDVASYCQIYRFFPAYAELLL